ncbi:MAG: TRAM domain-containing protein, partial [Xanthomonadales bacterium]|nr:TRAM domain-containing protein [Xanthomonadales bacterium]
MSRRRQRKLIEQPISLTIEDLSHDGRGIARMDGKVMFVNGALPGEEVVVKHTGGNKNFEEGITTEVITPSADRIEPE